MTARALRIGVLLGGNLVEEKLFADASPITLGQSLRCRLSLPIDGLPYEHVLFVRDQGQLLLRVPDRMTGRIAHGETIQTELAGTVRVERGARGKLELGEATLLFQEVAVPAKAPRPQLPASVRGTFADRIDRRLAVIIGGSILAHVAIAAWAWATEIERPALFESKQLTEYHPDTYPIDIPDEAPAPTSEVGTATPANPIKQTPAPIVTRTRITTGAPEPKMSTDDAQRFAQILTGNDETPGGRTSMSGKSPGAELDKQINDIRDNGRTIGGERGGFREGPRENLGNGHGPIVDGNNPQLTQEQHREEKTGRVDLHPLPPTEPPATGIRTPTPEQIIGKIKRDYMAGLNRCYAKGLAGDSSLSGKVKVSFTIAESGKTTDAGAHGVSSDVDACIASQVSTWRFPQPKDKDGDAVELDFSLSVVLVPGL
jgi:hypothetical protein